MNGYGLINKLVAYGRWAHLKSFKFSVCAARNVSSNTHYHGPTYRPIQVHAFYVGYPACPVGRSYWLKARSQLLSHRPVLFATCKLIRSCFKTCVVIVLSCICVALY